METQNTTNNITVSFENYTAEIDKSELDKDVIDIIFSNGDMIQFTKQPNNQFISTNGINGYGHNIANQTNGKRLYYDTIL